VSRDFGNAIFELVTL